MIDMGEVIEVTKVRATDHWSSAIAIMDIPGWMDHGDMYDQVMVDLAAFVRLEQLTDELESRYDEP